MLGRSIFRTGEYVRHFAPDDRANPFRKIYRQKLQDTLKIIGKLIADSHPRRILDIGSGMGRLSLQLTGLHPGRIVMADICVEMLALAAQKDPGSEKILLVNADAHRLPFGDGAFGIIVGLDLLCHLENPEQALAELRRLLTDTGWLILDSTNSNPLWTVFYPRYLGLNPVRWLKVIKYGGILPGWEGIVKHYSRERFMGLLRGAGFRVQETFNYGPRICPKWHLAISRKLN